MTKKEIVLETVQYYYTHKRGMKPGTTSCVYLNDMGDMCAFGRVMLPEIRAQYKNDTSTVVYSGTPGHGLYNIHKGLDNIIQEQYRGHRASFWKKLQSLHDMESNWSGNILSTTGLIDLELDFGIRCKDAVEGWYKSLEVNEG